MHRILKCTVVALCFALLPIAIVNSQSTASETDDVARMSDEEKISAARQNRTEMANARDRVAELGAEVTEAEGDGSRGRCIEQNLASIDGFIRVGARAFDHMVEALGIGDDQHAVHQFLIIRTVKQSTLGREADARQCAGFALTYTGDTQRRVEIDEMPTDVLNILNNWGGAVIIREDIRPNGTATF